MKGPWLVFHCGEEELAAYTLRGSFEGEAESTIELLAFERQISKEAIRAVCEERGESV